MNKQCRICLTKTQNLLCVNISNKLNEETTILEGIIEISCIQVLEDDTLPQFICNDCYMKLDQCYLLRSLIISSDKQLKQQMSIDCNSTCDEHAKQLLTDEDEAVAQFIDMKGVIDGSNSDEDIKPEQLVNEHDDILPFIIEHSSKIKLNGRKLKPAFKKGKCNIERRYKCSECGTAFKKFNHLTVHMAYKHLPKQFKCTICNKLFARKYDLAYHTRVHTGEKTYACELCGKSFASSSYFHLHKRMHAGQKKVKCDMCQNAFMHADQLQIHIRRKHTGERPFLCELCSHAFTSSSALFRHKRDVHDQKVKCTICNKSYSSRVLKDHIKRHKEREEGIKRFSCDICNKRFTCATSRKRHLVIHSGERAFKCEVCEKAFNQRSTLQTHMRVHSQIMPYDCDICNKSFRYKHHWKLHCIKYHENEGGHNSGQVHEVKVE